MANVIKLQEFGNQIAILFSDGTKLLAYPSGRGLWYVANDGGTTPSTISDTLLPGYIITNPGGTIESAWQWHIDNTTTDGGITGRGGVDLGYAYGTDIIAPADGTITHFDVPTVGQVIKLVLDTPVNRTGVQYVSDAFGPMVAVWFEHTSVAYDGHVSQGDIIGKSGDGYGQYGAHLHVHGLIDTGNVAGTSNRCNFWGFL